jgi:hypothetical protein
MHGTLPVYCETSLYPLGAFPAEPVNTATSFIPVLLGIFALIYLVRRQQNSRVAYVLAALTILTGMGSIAWHALRTDTTLFLDALPGVIYFAMILFFWLYYLGRWYMGLILLAGFVAMMVLLPPAGRQETQIVIVAVLAAVAAGLVLATWLRKRQAFGFALLMVGAAVIAFALRTLDLSVCATIPFGTHFFWHIFLGIAAYAGVRMIALLKREPGARVEQSGTIAGASGRRTAGGRP